VVDVLVTHSYHLPYYAQRLAKNPQWTKLPFPARELIDLEAYRNGWIKAHGSFSTNLVSSPGCPYQCNWCTKPISGNKFRLWPAAEVAEEMRQLKTLASAEHIWFGDDTFALVPVDKLVAAGGF